MVKPRRIRFPVNRVQIVDGVAFRAVLSEFAEGHESLSNAAKVLGVDRRTLSRLQTETGRASMALTTYLAIRTGLEREDPGDFGFRGKPDPVKPSLLERFTASVLSAEAELAVQRYEGWLEAELRHYRWRCVPVLMSLRTRETARNAFSDFLQRVQLRDRPAPNENDRILLAIFRAVEPLTAGEITMGMERTWEELDDQELEEYLRVALRREEILLDRVSDLDRARYLRPEAYEHLKAELADPENETYELPKGFWDDLLDVDPDSGGG